MTDSNIRIKNSGAAAVNCGDLDRVISAADGDAALLYLCLLRVQYGQHGDLAALSGLEPERFRKAAGILRELGLIDDDGPLSSPPETGPRILREKRDSDADFDALCRFYEHMSGRTMRPGELSALHDAYTRLSLPAPVIMTLITWLSTDGRFSAPRLERECCAWAEAGINTLEKAEIHLKMLTDRRSDSQRAARLMNITGRELSPTESRYIDSWLGKGFSPEAIELAYDRTVLNTGSLKWKYMDKILENWHSAGLHTPEQIKTERRPARNTPPADAGRSAPDAADPFMDEYARLVKEQLVGKGDTK